MAQPSREPTSIPAHDTGEAPPFTTSQRYSRQVLIPGIGASGQARLAEARVAIVGVGATGAAAASLLARAGVGSLRLIDRDFVEPSNLQRQILFDEDDARDILPKAEAARRKVLRFNSSIRVEAAVADLTPGNASELLGGVDLLLDATDNFEARYLLNDFAVSNGVPWIYSAALGATAATMNILPRQPYSAELAVPTPQSTPAWKPTACLACIFPDPPTGDIATCDTGGILGSAVTLAASIQCAEALKLLTGQPHLMRRTLLSLDLWQPTAGDGLHRAELAAGTPDPACTVCGARVFTHLHGSARPHITLCGRDAVQIHEHHRPLSLTALHSRLAALGEVAGLRSNSLLLRFRRGAHTVTVFADGRAVIQGTTDPVLARSLYARFIGA